MGKARPAEIIWNALQRYCDDADYFDSNPNRMFTLLGSTRRYHCVMVLRFDLNPYCYDHVHSNLDKRAQFKHKLIAVMASTTHMLRALDRTW